MMHSGSRSADDHDGEDGPPRRTREQFANDEEYGAYVEATLQAGMRVRARCHAEMTVEAGDEGVKLM